MRSQPHLLLAVLAVLLVVGCNETGTNSDSVDGVTVGFKEWWFNCRPSNTEPLLRLNVEARTQEMLDEKLAEIEEVLGKRD